MGQIQVLSFEVANLIAAGEVVDRPASAIKEMMENAIDAGAKHITVEIQNGGVSFMRVTDDGCGMSIEDLPMAIRRHATSKIKDATDLDGILSLGFRGEALAAISSVSDMRILSKCREDATGAMLEVRGGTLLGVSEFGCRDGTTVIVENLFANVPARRKFLKRDATESMAVSANVERVALSHPEIAVSLIVDGQQKLATAGDGQLKSAIYAVFGRDFAAKLLPIEGEHEGIKISGYIGRPDSVRVNRNYQTFFINHRFVRSKTASAAIEQAFVSYCAPEKYPSCVINIDLNPARVDVNVHPAKLEVKFSNEKPVFEAIYYTVRQALEQNTVRPSMTAPAPRAGLVMGGRVSDATTPIEIERPESLHRRQVTVDAIPVVPMEGNKPPQERITAEEYIDRYVDRKGNHTAQPTGKTTQPVPPPSVTAPAPRVNSLLPHDPMADVKVPMEIYEAEAARMGSSLPADEPSVFIPKIDHQTPPVPPPPPKAVTIASADKPNTEEALAPMAEPPHHTPPLPASSTIEPNAPAAPWRMVGEVFHSYILVEQGDRMLIIDKHAAHERIIFEDLKANLKEKSVDSQLLLLPIEVMLMSEEVGLLDTYRHELESIGFSFSCLRNTVRVEAIPGGIESGAVPDMMTTFAAQLRDGTGVAKLTRDIAFEKALYQASCKAAIKAGREYPAEQLAWLVGKLMAISDITYCPHGRPVAMEMKKRNIDHQFERC